MSPNNFEKGKKYSKLMQRLVSLSESDLIETFEIAGAWAAIGGHEAEIGGGKPPKEGWPPNWPPKEKGKELHRGELIGSKSALS